MDATFIGVLCQDQLDHPVVDIHGDGGQTFPGNSLPRKLSMAPLPSSAPYYEQTERASSRQLCQRPKQPTVEDMIAVIEACHRHLVGDLNNNHDHMMTTMDNNHKHMISALGYGLVIASKPAEIPPTTFFCRRLWKSSSTEKNTKRASTSALARTVSTKATTMTTRSQASSSQSTQASVTVYNPHWIPRTSRLHQRQHLPSEADENDKSEKMVDLERIEICKRLLTTRGEECSRLRKTSKRRETRRCLLLLPEQLARLLYD